MLQVLLASLRMGALAILLILSSCKTAPQNTGELEAVDGFSRYQIYSPFTLTTSLKTLSSQQKKMMGLLIDAAQIMDDLFWKQSFGEPKETFLNRISDPKLRLFAELNYGPWDRLDGDKPFIKGYGHKNPGAQFYPADMTKEEFEKASFKDKKGLYSNVVRGPKNQLMTQPFFQAYRPELTRAAGLLKQAAQLAQNAGFKKYLNMRAKALLDDNYQPSDLAWMDMKTNPIDFVVGPIESYEDQLYGYRTAYEAYVLVKDMKWSRRLARYAKLLPELQRNLPVGKAYKKEIPGTSADLNAYDVIYYAGHCNSGAKTIAINLPNDEEVQLKKGTRRLQLKNIMRAKFEKILVPISKVLVTPSQHKHITFNAFFANTMFHEVAHGLGIKKTINGKGMVRTALKDHASSMEEGKADVLGLFMITQLFAKGEIPQGVIEDHYVTFLAGIFRSIRFGATSAHGRANMVRFNFFKKYGAFTQDAKGRYQVNFKKMKSAVNALSKMILTLQGNGDYNGVDKLLKTMGTVGPDLTKDLKRLETANIPVDIQVIQGKKVLNL